MLCEWMREAYQAYPRPLPRTRLPAVAERSLTLGIPDLNNAHIYISYYTITPQIKNVFRRRKRQTASLTRDLVEQALDDGAHDAVRIDSCRNPRRRRSVWRDRDGLDGSHGRTRPLQHQHVVRTSRTF